ncbi:MAG: aspartate aminotransferase [Methanoculleus sp. SDB]|nr:MAG: aspartate aminotransferase [Methanoculleus sp. SDB]
MAYRFSRRMEKTPKSFIREILKVTLNPGVISFAGGLPNPDLIDVAGIEKAAGDLIREDGKAALQYSTTEGYEPLRQFIADRYSKRYGLSADPDEILITNGSQQCLDLIGKIFIDRSDAVVIERPGYLGAIQAFSLFEPVFHAVSLHDDGPDTGELAGILYDEDPKFFYGIPNSQNPTGITYSEEKRREIAEILHDTGTIFVEDDAYGEVRFDGSAELPVTRYLPGEGIMTGTFSKIFSPGMRLGWIYAPGDIMERLIVVKQASDLHSNYLSQRILATYLEENDIDAHIRKITAAYASRAALMAACMEKHFPDDITFTRPEGGMFIWVTFPEGISSVELFETAAKHNVIVLPGLPFYVDGAGDRSARFNFSNANPDQIRAGIDIIADVIEAIRK